MVPRPEVQKELERFICVELHIDGLTPPEIKERSKRYVKLQREILDTFGAPYWAVIENDGKSVVARWEPSPQPTLEEILGFLQKG
ncbi:MAG: hypothetical protein JNJ88_00875 [Planctomycetes bacterium]|nr:hypothetical protein [Planctomycetota bacterium]